MKAKRLVYILPLAAGIVCLSGVEQASARQTIVTGSLTAGYDYWERTYDDDTEGIDDSEGDRREWSLGPEVELSSLDIHNELILRYSPVVVYDTIEDTTDLDHYLDFEASQSLSPNWSVELADSFVFTSDASRFDSPFLDGDDVAEGEEPEADEISRDVGRSRFWTNRLSLLTTYSYAQESDVELGYAYRVLRNDSSDEIAGAEYDEYDRHEFSGGWSHRLNSSWRSEVDLSYILGLYEEDEEEEGSEDLKEYRADLGVDYIQDANTTFPFAYAFRLTDYENDRADVFVHELSAGWEHRFSSRTSVLIAAGPTYVDADEVDGDWGYNADFLLTRTYQHGDVILSAEKSYEPRNFTGSDDRGLTDITSIGLDVSYQLTRALLATAFAEYRYEDILEPRGARLDTAITDAGVEEADTIGDISSTRDSFSVGAGVDYTFLRWFVASVEYSYFIQDGDLAEDNYDEHRILFSISASRELWR